MFIVKSCGIRLSLSTIGQWYGLLLGDSRRRQSTTSEAVGDLYPAPACDFAFICSHELDGFKLSHRLANEPCLFRAPFGISGQSIAFASLAPQASEQSTDGFLSGGNKLSERGKQTQKCVRPCVAVGLFSFYWYILANKHRANLLRRIVSGFPGKQTNQSIKLIAKNISQRTFISIYSLLSHHPMWAGQQAHCWHVVVLLAYIHQ
jgi:hypothetical protein